jgi:hypothetical protein
MIKRWSKFNEGNTSDLFKDEINKIRKYFIEYEDDDVVSYEMYVCGYSGVKERDMSWSVNPNNGNFERWVDSQTEEANRYLDNESYRQLFLQTTELDNYPFAFCANIKIKSDGAILDDFGVEKLKDILVTWDRLRDNYDKVLINTNSHHHEYKPVSLIVYFNPIVD